MAQTSYTDLGTLKAYLNLADSDNSQDLFLSNLLRQVQGFVDRYTHRTFGWGDAGDNASIDYSNTDNIGVSNAVLNGTLLTITTMGPVPWVVGQNVSIFAMPSIVASGVYAVHQVSTAVSLVIDVSHTTGTISLGDTTLTSGLPTNFYGYIGNAVKNYQYISQEQYDGLVGKKIYLRHMDIRSFDTLYIGLRNIAQPVLLDHTQYVWRDDGRVILGGAYFNSYDSGIYASANDNSFYGTVAAGYQTITASYWCGYIGVPSEIQLAVLDVCTALFTLRKSLGVMQEKIGDYEIRYDVLIRKALANQPDSLNTLNMMRYLPLAV